MREPENLKGLIVLLILGSFVGSSCSSSQAGIEINEPKPMINVQKTADLEPVNLSADPMEVIVSVSKLVCREQVSPPSGSVHQPNRDVGFALVLINLENHQETPQVVTIQDIGIRNSTDGRLQSFNFEPKIVQLRPLEHAAVDIHLSNQTGYGEQHRMTAVVTYEINGQAYVIRSESADVDRL